MKFSIDNIQNIIKDAKNAQAKRGKKGPGTSIAFLPEGKHVVRFFLDPKEELFRDVKYHRLNHSDADGNRERIITPCPRINGHSDNCEICSLAYEVNDWRSGLSAKSEIIIYMQLNSTDKADPKYWTPGNWYAVLCRARFRKALVSFLENSTSSANATSQLIRSLQPTQASFPISVEYEGGAQGSCSLTLKMYALMLRKLWSGD